MKRTWQHLLQKLDELEDQPQYVATTTAMPTTLAAMLSPYFKGLENDRLMRSNPVKTDVDDEWEELMQMMLKSRQSQENHQQQQPQAQNLRPKFSNPALSAVRNLLNLNDSAPSQSSYQQQLNRQTSVRNAQINCPEDARKPPVVVRSHDGTVSSVACCGANIYDPMKQVCCGGVVTQPPTPKDQDPLHPSPPRGICCTSNNNNNFISLTMERVAHQLHQQQLNQQRQASSAVYHPLDDIPPSMTWQFKCCGTGKYNILTEVCTSSGVVKSKGNYGVDPMMPPMIPYQTRSQQPQLDPSFNMHPNKEEIDHLVHTKVAGDILNAGPDPAEQVESEYEPFELDDGLVSTTMFPLMTPHYIATTASPSVDSQNAISNRKMYPRRGSRQRHRQTAKKGRRPRYRQGRPHKHKN